jgi:DNA-binding MarR family transcriptional regulator
MNSFWAKEVNTLNTSADINYLNTYSEFLHIMGHKIRQNADCFQGSCQLNRTEFSLISLLEQHGSMMMKDLNNYLNEVSLSTLTRLIDRLEGDDYVKRSTDPSDRRCFMISLTDKSVTLLKGYPKQMDPLAADMLSCLTSDEQHTLIQLVKKMNQQICKRKGGSNDEA